jgi:hypothetical protein
LLGISRGHGSRHRDRTPPADALLPIDFEAFHFLGTFALMPAADDWVLVWKRFILRAMFWRMHGVYPNRDTFSGGRYEGNSASAAATEFLVS